MLNSPFIISNSVVVRLISSGQLTSSVNESTKSTRLKLKSKDLKMFQKGVLLFFKNKTYNTLVVTLRQDQDKLHPSLDGFSKTNIYYVGICIQICWRVKREMLLMLFLDNVPCYHYNWMLLTDFGCGSLREMDFVLKTIFSWWSLSRRLLFGHSLQGWIYG